MCNTQGCIHNKKYTLEKIEEFKKHNSIYNGVEGSVCYIAYLNVGDRGWILCEDKRVWGMTHKIHTTTIQELSYDGDLVVVKTKNTRLTFREIT